jgi:hypothetical protein
LMPMVRLACVHPMVELPVKQEGALPAVTPLMNRLPPAAEAASSRMLADCHAPLVLHGYPPERPLHMAPQDAADFRL